MITPEKFVNLMNQNIKGQDEQSVLLGTIPATYTTGLPTIQFDGETQASAKTYPYVASYIPKANDRVMLVKQGHGWVIVGSIGGNILLNVYPIGAIYMSVNSTDPGTLFGGTWVALQDRFLVGAGGLYAVNVTGGEVNHILTTTEMPSHTHVQSLGGTISTVANVAGSYVVGNLNSSNVTSTGGDVAHNNMPPYLAVYMWKRTA